MMSRKHYEVAVAIASIIENIDFTRACRDAGGNHEHAFWLSVSSADLEKAEAILADLAERIRRELERA